LVLAVGTASLLSCGTPDERNDALSALASEVKGHAVGFVNQPAVPVGRPRFSSADGFRDWQSEVRARLLGLIPMHSVASRPVDYQQIRRETTDSGLHRIYLTFASFDGSSIPAVVQYRRTQDPIAAILVVPGHVSKGESGLSQLTDQTESYQGAAATRLAEAGYATLAFELRGFGLLGEPFDTNHLHVAHNAIAGGTFYKSIILRDAQYAFDLLRSMEAVDAGRVGVTGASYGGEIAVALAALDSRISAVAFSSYGGSTGALPMAHGLQKPQQHYCHVIPGSSSFLRSEDMFLLVAPRPLRGFRGEQNANLDPEFVDVLNRSWALLEASTVPRLRIVPNRGHDFFVDETIAFFEETL
jgi:dienelactone hydrolase